MHTTLVSVATLAAHIDDPDWLIVDLRHELTAPQAGRAAFAAGHIPGALFLHLDDDLSAPRDGRNGRHPLPSREDFARRMAALGIGANTQLVVYDAQGGMTAGRLWWMMRWIGHAAVAVLDGGLPAWLGAGHALEAGAARPRGPAGLTLAPALGGSVDATSVLARLEDPAQLVIDARAPDRFRGENETIDPVGGHIPGARNRFFRDNLGPDGLFKPAETLRAEFSALLAGTPVTAVVAQCGSGVTACHNLLALEIAGLPGARLYPGSWSEWCADPQRPVATGS